MVARPVHVIHDGITALPAWGRSRRPIRTPLGRGRWGGRVERLMINAD